MLSGLTERHRMALVQITHYNNEAETADRDVNLSDSLDNTDMVESAAAPAATVTVRHRARRRRCSNSTRVGHEYGSGTPWAKTALRDVSFAVRRGRRAC